MIKGFGMSAISRRKQLSDPVLESYKFVPNLSTTLTLEESIRVIVQLILENVPLKKVKTLEILDEPEEKILSPLIQAALADLPLMQPDTNIITQLEMEPIPEITISNQKISEKTDSLITILKNVNGRGEIVVEASKTLLPEGFLLIRESLKFNFHQFSSTKEALSGFEVIVEHRFQNEQILLIQKKKSPKVKTCVKIDSDPNNLEWLSILQKAVKSDPNTVIFSEGSDVSGTLGLINCIRREPGTDKIRAVIIFDDFDIKFDPNHQFFEAQLRKGLGVNILKEGVWGKYH